MLTQRLGAHLGERHGARRSFRLGPVQHQALAGQALEGGANAHSPSVEVDVLPLKAEYLAPPESDHNSELDECLDSMPARCFEERPYFLNAKRVIELRGTSSRTVNQRRDVAYYNAPPFRVREGAAKDHPCSAARLCCKTPLLKLAHHPVYVRRCELRELHVSDIRNHVAFEHGPVAVDGRILDGAR